MPNSVYKYMYACVCGRVYLYMFIYIYIYIYMIGREIVCRYGTIYLLADLHYLNFSNQLMGIRSPSGFSYLWPGAFHISLQTLKTKHTQPKVEERRTNKQGFGFALSVRRGKFLALF